MHPTAANYLAPTLVLLHGFAEDSSIWNNLLPALQSHAQVLTPNLPGSGGTSFEPGVSDNLDAMAWQLWQWLPTQTTGPVIILGHSMGGYITLAMMEQQQAGQHTSVPVIGWGLVHSTALPDSAEKVETRQKAIQFMEQHGTRAFLQTAIPGLFAPSFAHEQAPLVNQLIDQGSQFTIQTLAGYYKAMIARPNRTDVLKNSSWPVYFAIGQHDKAAPMADVLPQTHLPAISQVEIWAEAGHMGMLEQPEKMAASILQFIKLCSA